MLTQCAEAGGIDPARRGGGADPVCVGVDPAYRVRGTDGACRGINPARRGQGR